MGSLVEPLPTRVLGLKAEEEALLGQSGMAMVEQLVAEASSAVLAQRLLGSPQLPPSPLVPLVPSVPLVPLVPLVPAVLDVECGYSMLIETLSVVSLGPSLTADAYDRFRQ